MKTSCAFSLFCCFKLFICCIIGSLYAQVITIIWQQNYVYLKSLLSSLIINGNILLVIILANPCGEPFCEDISSTVGKH